MDKEYVERNGLLKAVDRYADAQNSRMQKIIRIILQYPATDPIRAAGGCRCGECKRYMTPKCLLCSFDVDGSCTGGPESDFYCGDSELREAQNDE